MVKEYAGRQLSAGGYAAGVTQRVKAENKEEEAATDLFFWLFKSRCSRWQVLVQFFINLKVDAILWAGWLGIGMEAEEGLEVENDELILMLVPKCEDICRPCDGRFHSCDGGIEKNLCVMA